jgi:lysophospholipase L1-like esterase
MKTVIHLRSIAVAMSITSCITSALPPVFSPPALAAETNQTETHSELVIQAQPRLDRNSQKAHAQLLQKAKQGKIDVYFEGDSITRRWGTSDPQYRDLLANWTENFLGWNAADFGWGGDTVQNILWRLLDGELDEVHPRIIVLMAGTNNLEGPPAASGEEAKVEEVTRGIEAILAVMREKASEATVILMGITPRKDRSAETKGKIISRINDRISRLADGKRVRYLNLNRHLADPDGVPLEGMTVDGLHLSVKGYQVWADALKPIFRELLGPRGQTDQAPAPTGDPSVTLPTKEVRN